MSELDFLLPIATSTDFWRFYALSVFLLVVMNIPLVALVKWFPRLDKLRVALLVSVLIPLALALSGHWLEPFAPPPSPCITSAPPPPVKRVLPPPKPAKPLSKEEQRRQRVRELLRIYRREFSKE